MTTNVFIVDDSATARTALRLILETSDDINVIGVASNPLIALKRMNRNWPDVIISDIEMPEMNGIEFLAYIKRNKPTPFIVFSNYTGSSAVSSVEALSAGAIDIIAKPNFNCSESLEETTLNILNAIRAAAKLKLSEAEKAASVDIPLSTKEQKEAVIKQHHHVERKQRDEVVGDVDLNRQEYSIIAIGSSTGGTSIIEKILTKMHKGAPGVVIVQHMPEMFTKAFANRINQFCEIYVKEAEDGDSVLPGTALIAPGGKHMKITGRAPNYTVRVFDDDYVNRHKPSVDVLFNSVSEVARKDALGVILTGMGKDGAKGLLNMKKAGADTVAQSEEDCAVYGMPKAAKAMDAVDVELTSSEISAAISKLNARPY